VLQIVDGEWYQAHVLAGEAYADLSRYGAVEDASGWLWVLREGANWRLGPLIGDWFADAVEAGYYSIWDPAPNWA
jgi:hypothetical protein